MVNPTAKLVGLRTQYEQMLRNAILVTETAMELKERVHTADKYVRYLRTLVTRAGRVISTMNTSEKTFVLLAQRLATSALRGLEAVPVLDQSSHALKQEYQRLLAILDKEAIDADDLEIVETCSNDDIANVDPGSIAERLRQLEAKQKFAEQMYLPPSSSTRSLRPEMDEKYPENWSRESLIDLNNAMNLPTVPEDAFTGLSKPVRSLSSSSLKSIRKVKLYLQRTAHSEDEESEYDEHEFSMSVSFRKFDPTTSNDRYSEQDEPSSSSEGADIRPVPVLVKKGGGLCNIKEEASQDP